MKTVGWRQPTLRLRVDRRLGRPAFGIARKGPGQARIDIDQWPSFVITTDLRDMPGGCPARSDRWQKGIGTSVSKKDILKDGIYMPTAVGSNIYVWSEGGKNPAGKRACVITAHGIDMPPNINSGFESPNATVYFYAPHGNQLSDAGAAGVLRGKTKYYEKFEPRQCRQDYILTKAQGRHSEKSKENYSDFQKWYHPGPGIQGQQQVRDRTLQHVNPNSKFADATRRAIENDYQAAIARYSDLIMDVVSIRNRDWPHMQKQQTLFGVVAQLHKAGFTYSEVHCYFCRGAETAWQANENTGVG